MTIETSNCYLQVATNAVNANQATATKECPKDIFDILYNDNIHNQQPKTQIRQNLLIDQKQVEEKENKKRNDVKFKNNKQVWHSSELIRPYGPLKLGPRYLGTYKVVKQCGPVTLRIKVGKDDHRTFHASYLRKFYKQNGLIDSIL
jgi:hypothetical protein